MATLRSRSSAWGWAFAGAALLAAGFVVTRSQKEDENPCEYLTSEFGEQVNSALDMTAETGRENIFWVVGVDDEVQSTQTMMGSDERSPWPGWVDQEDLKGVYHSHPPDSPQSRLFSEGDYVTAYDEEVFFCLGYENDGTRTVRCLPPQTGGISAYEDLGDQAVEELNVTPENDPGPEAREWLLLSKLDEMSDICETEV